jgi:hypothetical protein
MLIVNIPVVVYHLLSHKYTPVAVCKVMKLDGSVAAVSIYLLSHRPLTNQSFPELYLN